MTITFAPSAGEQWGGNSERRGCEIMAGMMKRLLRRKPDIVIGPSDGPYLLRWYLIPRNRWVNIYLHQFLRDDDDRALHDHPWPSLSIVLAGGYYDITNGPDRTQCRRWYGPGSIIIRRATDAHRVELSRAEGGGSPVPAWTLFLTGPRVREWGFWCPKGWVHWRLFTSGENGEVVGRGCDQ